MSPVMCRLKSSTDDEGGASWPARVDTPLRTRGKWVQEGREVVPAIGRLVKLHMFVLGCTAEDDLGGKVGK